MSNTEILIATFAITLIGAFATIWLPWFSFHVGALVQSKQETATDTIILIGVWVGVTAGVAVLSHVIYGSWNPAWTEHYMLLSTYCMSIMGLLFCPFMMLFGRLAYAADLDGAEIKSISLTLLFIGLIFASGLVFAAPNIW